jgi:hypothetical protein
MNAPNDNTAARGLRGWASPPRSGMRRIISPWEYHHLRAFAGMRIAGGMVAFILGSIVVSEVSNAWVIFGAFLLAVAVANFLFAFWELTIARSEPARDLSTLGQRKALMYLARSSGMGTDTLAYPCDSRRPS